MVVQTEQVAPTRPGPVDEAPGYLHLRNGGVSVLLDLGDERLPTIRHWGADLGELTARQIEDVVLATRPPVGDSPMDVADRVTVLPEHASAWLGRPGLDGSRSGRDWSAALRTHAVQHRVGDDGTQLVRVRASDDVALLSFVLDLELSPAGLLSLRGELVNDATEPFSVAALRLAVPVPPVATELLDFTGRHSLERIPQRQPFNAGVHSRESRSGRPGLDSPYLLVAGEAGFGFTAGEAWAIHLGWSGNQNVYAERLHHGARLLGASELLGPDEVVLGGGESYRSPWVRAAYGVGLNAVAARFHRLLRDRTDHPQRPRPVIINTWEAVYFDQSLAKLTALADRAAELGIERFVLDDGWFAGRRDDTTSLGDWTVSADVWPDGLGPLVEHVTGLGLEFGLWVEPEMVSLDSDLARAHPEWLFSTGGRTGLASRYQHVLDLGHPGAYAHIRASLQALLDTYPIGYLKWDHNRNLNDAGHTPGGEPGVHAHTLAVYRLLDELRATNPGLEIEGCAGGGGRIDLGIAERVDRFWPSDCNDALERQPIQRWTQLLLPPELIGTHVGDHRSHTTLRQHDLTFRAATALWGHLGVESDLTRLSSAELAELKAWIGYHQANRDLLHTGTVVVGDHPDPAIWVNGVVSTDRRDALFAITALRRSEVWPPGPIRLPGLAADTLYRLQLDEPGAPTRVTTSRPAWTRHGVTLSGRTLATVGVQGLPIFPEHSYLLRAASAPAGA